MYLESLYRRSVTIIMTRAPPGLYRIGFFFAFWSILSSASGPWIGVVAYGLCERGHLEGAAEAVTEVGKGTYAQLLRCLHQRCKNVHCTDASLAAAV